MRRSPSRSPVPLSRPPTLVEADSEGEGDSDTSEAALPSIETMVGHNKPDTPQNVLQQHHQQQQRQQQQQHNPDAVLSTAKDFLVKVGRLPTPTSPLSALGTSPQHGGTGLDGAIFELSPLSPIRLRPHPAHGPSSDDHTDDSDMLTHSDELATSATHERHHHHHHHHPRPHSQGAVDRHGLFAQPVVPHLHAEPHAVTEARKRGAQGAGGGRGRARSHKARARVRHSAHGTPSASRAAAGAGATSTSTSRGIKQPVVLPRRPATATGARASRSTGRRAGKRQHVERPLVSIAKSGPQQPPYQAWRRRSSAEPQQGEAAMPRRRSRPKSKSRQHGARSLSPRPTRASPAAPQPQQHKQPQPLPPQRPQQPRQQHKQQHSPRKRSVKAASRRHHTSPRGRHTAAAAAGSPYAVVDVLAEDRKSQPHRSKRSHAATTGATTTSNSNSSPATITTRPASASPVRHAGKRNTQRQRRSPSRSHHQHRRPHSAAATTTAVRARRSPQQTSSPTVSSPSSTSNVPATPDDDDDDGAKAETPEAESPTEQPAQGHEATADQLVEIGTPDVVGSVQVVEEHVPVARARTQRRAADSLEAAEFAPWGKHDEQQPAPHTQQQHQQRPAKKRKRRRRKPTTSADVVLDGTASTVITDDGGSVRTSGGRHKLTSIKPKVPSHTVKRRRGAARRFASNDDFKQLKAQCKITSPLVGCCSGLVPTSHLCVCFWSSGHLHGSH